MKGERPLASEEKASISSIRDLAPASVSGDIAVVAKILTSLKNLLLHLQVEDL